MFPFFLGPLTFDFHWFSIWFPSFQFSQNQRLIQIDPDWSSHSWRCKVAVWKSGLRASRKNHSQRKPKCSLQRRLWTSEHVPKTEPFAVRTSLKKKHRSIRIWNEHLLRLTPRSITPWEECGNFTWNHYRFGLEPAFLLGLELLPVKPPFWQISAYGEISGFAVISPTFLMNLCKIRGFHVNKL